MVANHVRAGEEILKLNTMASENIKSIEEMRTKIDRYLIEKADLQIKIKHLCWINEKPLNNLENNSGQVASLHIKTKGLKNANHQMHQEMHI